MPLFTFIVEHDGASSVSQVRARNKVQAVKEWKHDLPMHLGEIMSARQLRWMAESLDTVTPIDGRVNVWSVCGLTRSPENKAKGGVAEVFLIETASNRRRWQF